MTHSENRNDFNWVWWCLGTDLNRRHADFQSSLVETIAIACRRKLSNLIANVKDLDRLCQTGGHTFGGAE